MGWSEVWKTASDWSNAAWTQAAKLNYTLNNISIPEVVTVGADFTFNTFTALMEEVAAIPHLMKSVVFHPKTRRTFGHLARIGVEDYGSMVVANQLKQILESSLLYALEGSEAAPWLSFSTVIWSTLMLLRAGHGIYNFGKQTQILIRVSMVAIEASGTITSANPQLNEMERVCIVAKDSKLSAALGSISDVAKYTLTDLSIKQVKKIPVVGPAVGTGLAIKHNGDYIVTAVLKGMCPSHARVYLQEYPHLPWALGLTHTATSLLFKYFAEYYTGMPQDWYGAFVDQVFLVGLIGIAAHMRLPPPVNESIRNIPDPIRFYKEGLQVGLEVIGYGLKVKIPQMLGKEPVVPWGKIFSALVILWNHPSAQWPKWIILPPMLHGKKAFYRDPVVEPNWESLRTRIITAIELIEKYQKKLLVATAKKVPKISAKIAAILGAPQPVVTLALRLMANNEFMANLADFRRRLEKMNIIDMPASDKLRPVEYLNTDSPSPKKEEQEPPKSASEADMPLVHVSPEEMLKGTPTGIESSSRDPLQEEGNEVFSSLNSLQEGRKQVSSVRDPLQENHNPTSAVSSMNKIGLFRRKPTALEAEMAAHLDPGNLLHGAKTASTYSGKDPLGLNG